MSCILDVSEGRIQGKQCSTYNGRKYYSFEGIPYAKPPVGKLRFRDPQEPESWSGIRDATKPGNKCAQMDPYSKKSLDGSEDCLYLNVYTPSLPGEKLEQLPVIFYVHGGRFLVGYGDYYKPDYFLENDVIVVTINYRLHILGFLCLNIPEAPGNATLKDTVMALKWVKKNISNFNGNDKNVTAFGESAGGGLVSSYVSTKMTDGLVHKIIAASGASLSDLYMIEEDPIEKARHIASILGKELNNERELHDFLIKVDIEDLVFAASVAELSRPPYIINAYFLPVIEKKFDGIERFFEEFPLVPMLQNRHTKIPVLVGLNSHEGALFLRKDDDGNIEYLKDTQRFIPRYLSMNYDSPKSVKLGRNLKDFYFGNKEIDDNSKTEYVNFVSDAYFNRDVTMFAEILSRYSDEVFFYNFCYSGNMNTRVMKTIGLTGASHGDIVQYQFYRKTKAEISTEKDREIVKVLSEAWCNFAKNGKPSWTDQQIEWRPFKPGQHLCLNIGTELTLQEYPNWNRVKFWLDNMGQRSKL